MQSYSIQTSYDRVILSVVVSAIVFSLSSPVLADWPQWRGPNRDGHALVSSVPKSWPPKLTKRWSVVVGIGQSSPIVADGQVFQFSRQHEEEVVRRLDLATGEEIWKSAYAAPHTVVTAAKRFGSGPKSTPVVGDGRLFTFGITGIFSGWNVDTGERIWQNDFGSEFNKTSPAAGAAASPIIYNGKVIIHVGGHRHGALRAFDARTGDVQWAYGADGPSFASPVISTFGESVQLVTLTESAVVAVSPDTGKLLWKVPFGNAEQNIVTPVVCNGIVLLSCVGEGRTCAIRPTETGGKWSTEELWSNRKIPFYMSTPVLVGKRLVGFTNRRRGQLVCSSIDNGEMHWVSSPQLGENAALVVAGSVVLAQLTTGKVLIIDPTTDEMKTIAEYITSDKETWAHPALANGLLLTKDFDTLTCWAFK